MKKYLLVVLMSLSTSVFSAGTWIELNHDDYKLWPGTYTIDHIRLQLPARTTKFIDPDSCAKTGASSYYVQSTLPEAVISRSYALILAAKMSKQSLNFYITGCESGFPTIQ